LGFWPFLKVILEGSLPKVGMLKKEACPKLACLKMKINMVFCIYKKEHKERQTKLCKALLDEDDIQLFGLALWSNLLF
jgi:hypothetical protein